MTNSSSACKRPYDLGRRSAATSRSKSAVLRAAREKLASNDFSNFTMELLARTSGVSRQTVHNLFGTKSGVLEALFDELAAEGGLEGMGEVMRRADPQSLLLEFVRVFVGFWAKDRALLRRIHALAALDSEFAMVVEARQQRRRAAACRILDRVAPQMPGATKRHASTVLFAMTSFEFFDAVFEDPVSPEEASDALLDLIQKAIF